MSPDADDLAAVTLRINQLSRENHWLKAGFSICILLALFAFLQSAKNPNAAYASSENDSNSIKASTIDADTVSARRFLVNGKNGTAMLSIETQGELGEPVLKFFGPEPLHPEGRVLRLAIGVTPDPEITVYHAFGPQNNHKDKILSFTFFQNEPQLILRSGKGNLTGMNPGGLMIVFDDDRPSVVVRDSKGHTAQLTPH